MMKIEVESENLHQQQMMMATLGNLMAKVRSRGGAKMDIDEADLKGNMRKSG